MATQLLHCCIVTHAQVHVHFFAVPGECGMHFETGVLGTSACAGVYVT